jgi:hypothetical protein
MIIKCNYCKFEGDIEDFSVTFDEHEIPNNQGTAIPVYVECLHCEAPKNLIATLRI